MAESYIGIFNNIIEIIVENDATLRDLYSLAVVSDLLLSFTVKSSADYLILLKSYIPKLSLSRRFSREIVITLLSRVSSIKIT